MVLEEAIYSFLFSKTSFFRFYYLEWLTSTIHNNDCTYMWCVEFQTGPDGLQLQSQDNISYLIFISVELSLPGWDCGQTIIYPINSLVFLPSFNPNKKKSINGTVTVCSRIIFICFWPWAANDKMFLFEKFLVPWPLHQVSRFSSHSQMLNMHRSCTGLWWMSQSSSLTTVRCSKAIQEDKMQSLVRPSFTRLWWGDCRSPLWQPCYTEDLIIYSPLAEKLWIAL